MEQRTVPITEIILGDRFRKDYGDLSELKGSIETHGLINPIAVMETDEGLELAAGGRRLQSMVELGLTEVTVWVFEGDELDLRSIELAENIFRKDLEWPEKVALVKRLDTLQKEKFGSAGQGRKDPTKGWTIGDTAKALGLSDVLVRSDIKLAEAIEEIPALAELDSKEEAKRAYTKLQEALLLDEIAKRRVTQAKAKKGKLIESYIVSDIFDSIKKIPDQSFDLIDADPPYGVSYNTMVEDWKDDWSDWDETKYKSYFPQLIRQFHRVLTPTGWLIVWLASRNLDITIDMLEKFGFKVWRVPAIWVKSPGSCVQPKVQLKNSYEPFLYAQKGHGEVVKQGNPNVFMVPQSRDRIHQAEKPIDLMKSVLEVFGRTGDRVLVPFAGSGNTIIAAHELKMSAVAYDLSKKHRDKFIVRATGGENVRDEEKT